MRPILAILALLLAAPAFADDATPPTARLRGTIERVSADTVTILTQDGQHQAVLSNEHTKVGALRPLTW